MKKSLKIISILLVAIMMVVCISTNVFAANVDTVIDDLGKADGGNATTAVSETGGKIVDIVSTIGIVAAVIILMVIGVRYMMGSASEKAEYKKVMIPYIIGAIILFSAGSIVKALAHWEII